MPHIYLDHNATTPLASEAYRAMQPYLTELVGNASSLHWAGETAKKGMETARQQVAALIKAEPNEILFTGGATESINTVLKGLLPPVRRSKHHLVVSAVEHPATLEAAETLRTWGVSVSIVPVDAHGRIDPQAVVDALQEDTGLVSLLWANNEIGNIYPVAEIISLCHERGVPVHLDAAQAVGKIDVDVNLVPTDFLSFSAHKIYGPQGIGALYIRKGRKLRRLHDGGAQERNRRGGTENIAGLVGFGSACELARHRLLDDQHQLRGLLDYLEQGLRNTFPHIIIHGDPEHRLDNTLNVHIPGIGSEALLIALDLEGVAVSSGSACASGTIEPSHVLMAMGASPDVARSAIRFSLGRDNRREDIDYVLELLPRVVRQLKAA